MYALFACYGCLGVYWFNKWMYPREYASEEEKQSKRPSRRIHSL